MAPPIVYVFLFFGGLWGASMLSHNWDDIRKNIGKREADYNGTTPTHTPYLSEIKVIQAKYEKSRMMVSVEFDRPFNGIIFSEGHSTEPHCQHLPPGSGLLSVALDIDVSACGMTSSDGNNRSYGNSSSPETFIESTINIQYDSLVHNKWDQSVTFQVNVLPFVTANYARDNVVRWMQIEFGKGPLAFERSGMVGIGQSMTMVL